MYVRVCHTAEMDDYISVEVARALALIRDEWLQPLIAENGELRERLGREYAEHEAAMVRRGTDIEKLEESQRESTEKFEEIQRANVVALKAAQASLQELVVAQQNIQEFYSDFRIFDRARGRTPFITLLFLVVTHRSFQIRRYVMYFVISGAVSFGIVRIGPNTWWLWVGRVVVGIVISTILARFIIPGPAPPIPPAARWAFPFGTATPVFGGMLIAILVAAATQTGQNIHRFECYATAVAVVIYTAAAFFVSGKAEADTLAKKYKDGLVTLEPSATVNTLPEATL